MLQRVTVFLALVCVGLMLTVSSGYGEIQVQPGMNKFMDALEAIDQRQLDKAESAILEALRMEPNNLEYTYHLGVIKSLKGEWVKALSIFEGLLKEDPQGFFKAYFDIANIYVRQKNLGKALLTLETARNSNPQNGRVYLEMASVLKDMGRYREALDAISKAVQYDTTLEQSCYLLKGVVEMEMRAFDEALRSLERARDIAPDSPVGKAAKDTIAALPDVRQAARPLFANMSLSWTFDDNVAQEPLEDLAKTGISTHKRDQYETFYGRFGYRLIKTKTAECTIGYGVYNVGYKDKVDSDTFAHIPFLSLSLRYGALQFTLPYEFYYFYTGGKDDYQDSGFFLTFGNHSDRKLKMHNFSPIISIFHKNNMQTDFSFTYQNKEYVDTSPDSNLYSIGVTHRCWLDKPISPRIGIKFTKDNAETREATYKLIEVLAGVSIKLPLGFSSDLSLSHVRTYYDYNDPILFPIWYDKREDKSYSINLGLMRQLTRWISLYANYMYYHNNSNCLGPDPYKFERNTFSIGTSINF